MTAVIKKIPVLTYEELQRQNVLDTLNIVLQDLEMNIIMCKRAIKAVENGLDFFDTEYTKEMVNADIPNL